MLKVTINPTGSKDATLVVNGGLNGG